MPRYYGNRIMLREYKREDLEYMRKWVNNAEIVDNLGDVFITPQTFEQSQEFLENKLKGNSDNEISFIIADKDTEEYIGQIDLLHIKKTNGLATLGVVIGNEEKLGKGYGSEAIKLILKFAFERLNLHKVELNVRDFNKRAENCYRKCGFKEEGRSRENIYINGRYCDTIHMGILRSEFEEMND